MGAQKPYIVLVYCNCCKGSGKIKTYEGNPVNCPYCEGTGKRKERQPHPTHQMTAWRSEIRCPGDTPRFYGVRECVNCGEEEMQHAAGHFLNQLGFPCKEAKTI
jgi:DnaJ-class molecular chaperone